MKTGLFILLTGWAVWAHFSGTSTPHRERGNAGAGKNRAKAGDTTGSVEEVGRIGPGGIPAAGMIAAEAMSKRGPAGKPQKMQKVILFMLDGFGEEYYRNSDMPNLNFMEKHGLYKVAPSLMPSVTNLNNASICTGEWPSRHGITGNSFLNPASGEEEFMEEDSLVLAPTLFQRAGKMGVRSLLFSSKRKTVELLPKGSSLALSPESAPAEWVQRLGTPPDIYSREVNYWLLEAALYSMRHDSVAGLFYIHTTDYPMHTWAAEDPHSREHLHVLDSLIGLIMQAEPEAMILITADHTVKHKNFCWDLGKACASRNTPVRFAISPERDKYVKHHRGFGGASYVYLNHPADVAEQKAVTQTLLHLHGVEEVIPREEAVRRYHLMPERIGDLLVLADSMTVFGDLDKESEELPATYRGHGSAYEARTPVFVYHARQSPPMEHFTYNYKIADWLYR